MRCKYLIPVLLAVILLVVYLIPVPSPAFEQIYANAPAAQKASLQAFRDHYPPSTLKVDQLTWEYISVGTGSQAILFLHGMTGSYDIWWQQIEALKSEYRIIAVTYPPATSLEEMERGVLAILNQENIDQFNVVGSSLGGYFAQYLLDRHPDRIQKAVLANTFPPNDLIKEKNGTIGALIPYLPEWLVMNVLHGSFTSSIYPASKNDELTLAFLNEISSGRMRKAQVAARYACVVEKFDPPVSTTIPLLIIEASNDPLVEASLREQLKATYPTAQVVTVENGHFPYISTPDFYTQQIRDFLTP